MGIPDRMKAWVLKEPGRLELCEVPVPVIREDEVLVKIDRGCICNGSDPGIFHGHEAYQTPLVFGHEASGRIVAKGSGVQKFSVGDRVCWWFAAGAFAWYQAVSPARTAMFLVPEEVSLDQAPVMELVLAACRALMAEKPRPWQNTLAVCGLGPSGLVLTQYAKALGYRKVIGWDLYGMRRDLALRLGADEVYDPAEMTDAKAESLDKADIGKECFSDGIREKLPALFLGYFQMGGSQVQVNVLDEETLRAAYENPEEHRDVIVRVGGFTDYYYKQTREIQRDILERVAHGIG